MVSESSLQDVLHEHCPGSLRRGSTVNLFVRSASKWVQGTVVDTMRDVVRVEFDILDHFAQPHTYSECCKCVRMDSKCLHIPPDSAPCTSTVLADKLEENIEKPLVNQACPLQTSPEGLMQGCHERGGYGTPSAEDKYLNLAFLWRILESRDVVLIKGSWLVAQYRQGAVLPCRQELPAEAYWDPGELRSYFDGEGRRLVRHVRRNSLTMTLSVKLMSVSHCWYTKSHPDPDGQQLQDIGPLLEDYIYWPSSEDFYCGGDRTSCPVVHDLAVFWCWCSFYQDRPSKPRTIEEQKAFDRAFPYMDLWYANQNCDVWMLTDVPQDVDNSRPYDERGWTTWERTVSTMLTGEVELAEHVGGNIEEDAKGAEEEYTEEGAVAKVITVLPWEGKQVLDLARSRFARWESEALRDAKINADVGHFVDDDIVDNMGYQIPWASQLMREGFDPVDDYQVFCWRSMQHHCSCSNRYLVAPDTFAMAIKEKHFTKGNTDLWLVEANYRKNFGDVVSVMREINLSDFDVAKIDVFEGLSSAMRNWNCRRLRMVNLNGCIGVGDAGVKVLAIALARCPQLSRLSLSSCRIGNAGANDLAMLLTHCPQLEMLDLSDNTINDSGVRAFVCSFLKCPWLCMHWGPGHPLHQTNVTNSLGISLSGCDIGEYGAVALAAILHECPRISWFDLSRCHIYDDGAEAFADALLKCSSLHHFAWLSLDMESVSLNGHRSHMSIESISRLEDAVTKFRARVQHEVVWLRGSCSFEDTIPISSQW